MLLFFMGDRSMILVAIIDAECNRMCQWVKVVNKTSGIGSFVSSAEHVRQSSNLQDDSVNNIVLQWIITGYSAVF